MKLIVNGKETGFSEDLTVSELLVEHEVKMPDMVSVELNGQILKRSDFENTELKDGDKAEFLYSIRSLLLQLRWKSEFLREIPYLRNQERRVELVETFSCFLRTGYSEWHKARVFRKMTLETGVEITVFNQFREPTPPGQYDDHLGTVWLTQWSLSSDFLGYRLITQIGFRLERRRFEDTPPRTMGTGFCTVIAGIQE